MGEPWEAAALAPTRSIAAVRVLRISVTDRCNYRCVYCMPVEGMPWIPREQLLSIDEIVEVAAAAARVHGIGHFKITGGEPTVRPDLIELVSRLKKIPGVHDLSMTTNGQQLAKMAGGLRAAGLDRVTISLDSLQPEKFRRITRTGDLAAVLAGIEQAQLAGFKSVKINCVTMRGVNDDELVDFAELSRDWRVTVRFIEYMPLGESALLESETHAAETHAGPAAGCDGQDRGRASLISEAEVRDILRPRVGELLAVSRESESGVGPATVWKLADPIARGRIGFISAMSAPFCATCNRLRLTADGKLQSCLFDGGSVDVMPIVRDPLLSGLSRQRSLADAMARCVQLKPTLHSGHGILQMSRIGG